MTQTMLKVTFEDLREPIIKPMPTGAVIRHVGEQHGRITLWFETDLHLMDRKGAEEREVRRFAVCATGHPIPDGAVYLGTVPLASLAWHIFEVIG